MVKDSHMTYDIVLTALCRKPGCLCRQESADCYRTVGPSAAIDLTSAPWSSGAEVLDDDASFQDDGEAMFHAFRCV